MTDKEFLEIATEFTVWRSEDGDNCDTMARCGEKWGVFRDNNDRLCWNKNKGHFEYSGMPSGRPKGWERAHRFGFKKAFIEADKAVKACLKIRSDILLAMEGTKKICE